MRGLAQTLFIEKEKRLPWKGQIRHVQPRAWSFLGSMLKSKRLSYVDYALADRLLRRELQPREDVAALICHLSLAARSGHLCIIIDELKILPEPRQIWCDPSSDNPELSEKELNTLEALIRSGIHHLSASISSNVTTGQLLMPLTPLCRNKDKIYLQRNWVYESLFFRHWHRIEAFKPTLELNHENLQQQLKELLQQKRLLPEQAGAILQVAQQSLTIITGGPGTGKTYTAGLLIKLFWENLTPEQQKRCEIALAAPTGKAASNLQGSLKKALGNLDIKIAAPKTLHSLLGIKSSSNRGDNTAIQLSADIVLIDESSMIDVRLMAQLFAAIKPGARLILLGDRYQLPPVEAGGLFSDLIHHKEGKIGELRTCLRAELKEIVELAESINQGNIEATLQVLANESSKGVQRFHVDGDPDNVKLVHKGLLNHCESLFPQNINLMSETSHLLEAFNRFRILSPLRQGPFGVDEINRLFLAQALKKVAKGSWFMAPIMIVRNDYRLGLLNGETGVLLIRSKGNEGNEFYFQEGDYALFPSNNESEPVRKLSALMLPKFEYAYCLSVHKSQGSEFERLLLLNPKGSESFGREVLYTAVTRARRQLEIWSSDEVLSATIARKTQRLSGLSHLT